MLKPFLYQTENWVISAVNFNIFMESVVTDSPWSQPLVFVQQLHIHIDIPHFSCYNCLVFTFLLYSLHSRLKIVASFKTL